MKAPFYILFVAGMVVVGAFALWHFNFLPFTSNPAGVQLATSTGALAPGAPLATDTPVTADAGAGLRLYTNSAYHLSLKYPQELVATEYQEQGGGFTVTFEDPQSNEGFEIFIVPYAQAQVTSARFAMDEPSGVHDQPTNVVVGGVPAEMFFGNNAVMGDTREVWFIRSGYLYEVATYKALDSWLSQIMATWQFI